MLTRGQHGLDQVMTAVDAARAEDVTAAFSPLAMRAATLDSQIAKLEQQLEAAHGNRVAVVSALAWAGGGVDTERSAREQVEAQMRAQAAEDERNEQARRHGEQAAEIARQHAAEDEARRQREESEALAARQATALR